MKVMENDTDWQFVTIGDQVTVCLCFFIICIIYSIVKVILMSITVDDTEAVTRIL